MRSASSTPARAASGSQYAPERKETGATDDSLPSRRAGSFTDHSELSDTSSFSERSSIGTPTNGFDQMAEMSLQDRQVWS